MSALRLAGLTAIGHSWARLRGKVTERPPAVKRRGSGLTDRGRAGEDAGRRVQRVMRAAAAERVDPAADFEGLRPRIVLVRHGRPDIAPTRWIGHRAFRDYIDRYQRAGLAEDSEPPAELRALTDGAQRVFTSELPRAIESAHRLLPGIAQVSDPVFTEAPLASPPLSGLRLKVPAWAVLARLAWHGGYTPSIETYRQAKLRAARALRILSEAAADDGRAVLVAHGYFNAILGRMLGQRGWRRVFGAHRAVYWNTVVYDWPLAPNVETMSERRGRGRSSSGTAG